MEEIKNYIEAFGAEMSDPDIRDYRIDTLSLATEFPEEFELSMPPVKNQGTVGSCVAQSIALAAEYYNKSQYNSDEKISVGYIYGNRVLPLGKKQGMVTRYAISNYCAEGAPLEKDFPLHCEVPEIIEAVEEKKESLYNSAQKYRFAAYIKTKTKEEIKTALMNGYPVIIAVDWQKDMCYRDGKFFSTFLYGKSAGHAMVIYGWDDYGWKVQNSWGEDWGNKGTAIWSYNYRIREAYSIIDADNTTMIIKKPFSTDNKIGKFFVRVLNKIYCLWYKVTYGIKGIKIKKK